MWERLGVWAWTAIVEVYRVLFVVVSSQSLSHPGGHLVELDVDKWDGGGSVEGFARVEIIPPDVQGEAYGRVLGFATCSLP